MFEGIRVLHANGKVGISYKRRRRGRILQGANQRVTICFVNKHSKQQSGKIIHIRYPSFYIIHVIQINNRTNINKLVKKL